MDQLFAPDDGEPPRTRTAVPVSDAPLAVRMRPQPLDEVVGQEHLLAEDAPLRRAIEEGRPHSMILHGPPGSGKTTLARIVAAAANAAFEELSAVEVGRAEVRQVLERAEHRREATGERTVLFLDEIHRFNKAQQDALLPAVEEGLVTLIGATTENPYFEVNSALISRVAVYELQPLGADEVEALLRGRERGECERRSRRRARVPRRARGRRRADGAGGARDRVRDERRRRGRRSSAGRDGAAAAGDPLRQAPATSTTTTSRRGSRRRAGRTPTRRSTTSR